mgnify:CR=1 FL=1|jgi:hypothetical protein
MAYPRGNDLRQASAHSASMAERFLTYFKQFCPYSMTRS